MSELPTGWSHFSLRDFGGLSGGKTPSKANLSFWSSPDVPWVSPKDMKRKLLVDAEDRISQLAVEDAGMTLYPAGSVLMVTRSGILQHTFPVALAGAELTVNQDIKVLRPVEGITPQFAFYLLKSFGGEILSACSKDGTTVQSIDSEKLEAFPFPLPPAAEQTRIAAKLDELLAQVDTLKARIDGIPALLKRFRQSVLAAAVSGRLTEEWRKAGKAIPHLRIGDVCDFRNGFAYKSSDYKKDGIPLVRISDIDGRYAFPSDEIYIDQSLCDERYLISQGDLLIAMSGATTGKIGVYIGDAPALQNQRVGNFLVNSKGQITSEYRNIAISQMAGEIIKSAYGGAQPNISSKEICALRINVPSIDEQTEIVRRVEQLFAFADQLEAKVASAKSRIDHLTQSILAKAFRGELVPQDPNDEPASVLLERIKAQRAAAPKAKRGRRAATPS